MHMEGKQVVNYARKDVTFFFWRTVVYIENMEY